MAKIKQIKASEILNTKGEPTIEATVILSDGKVGVASSPSGDFPGGFEAHELKDADPQRFLGKGVLKAIASVENIIAPALLGMEANQREIDKKIIELDGTQNKGKLGANATYSVSAAVAKAQARSSVLPVFLYLREYINKENLTLKVPTPIFSLITDAFDFLVVPASSKTYLEAISITENVLQSLKTSLGSNNLSTLNTDKGSLGPTLPSNEDGLFFIKQAIEASGYKVNFDIFLGIDARANSIYRDQRYHLKERTTLLSSDDLVSYYEEISKKYNLLYIEDPFWEEDWDAWSKLMQKISSQTLLAGDNLTATNPYRLQMALNKKAISAISIKPSQIGTVLESLAVVEIARQAGLKIITSSRSAETNDDFIADFAVAISSDYIKLGGLSGGEVIAKYNRLFQIEKQLKTL
jgi:enolase